MVLRISSINNETYYCFRPNPDFKYSEWKFRDGEHFVDCVLLDKFPLSSWDYIQDVVWQFQIKNGCIGMIGWV